MRIKVNLDLKVGEVVRNFVLIDLLLFAGWGFLAPIFPIFVVQNVENATLTTIGIAAAIYLVIKSVLQLPVANFIDGNRGYRDDFFILSAGLLLASFSAFAFIFVKTIWQLYLVEALHGIAFSLYTPSWSAIFSKHLDRDRVSFDWSLDSTTVGLSAGVTGLAGSILAEKAGFGAVFAIAGVFSMLAVLVLMAAPQVVFPKTETREEMRDHHNPME